MGNKIKEGLNVTKCKMLFLFEGNYGNPTFAHVMASYCCQAFFKLSLYFFCLDEFCILCCSVSNISRQNVEIHVSQTEL